MPKEAFQLTHRRLLFVLLLVVFFLFAACSSAPSEAEGRKVLEDEGAKLNLFKVNSFTKTNGMSGERGYTMMFEADLECLHTSNPNKLRVITKIFSFEMDCEKQGQMVKAQGRMVFEKTENGWRIMPNQPPS